MTISPVLLMVVGALCAIMGAVAWHFIQREVGSAAAPAQPEPAPSTPSVSPAPAAASVAAAPAPAPVAAVPPVSPEEEEGRLFAVIAAAVAAVIREPHFIRGLHPIVQVKSDHHIVHPWSSEGRRAQFSSHRIR